MKVHHVSAATLCPPMAQLVNGKGGYFARGSMVCHCWIIETERCLVVVDTGLGIDDLADLRGRLGSAFMMFAGPRRDSMPIAKHVEKLGFERDDVRHIVPTHLDLDHAGGLPDFPNAEVHVMRAEKDAATKPPTTMESHRYRPVHFAHGPKWKIHDEAGDTWRGFSAVREIAGIPGLFLMPLAGHTRGHTAVVIEHDDKFLIHAGDAYFHHREMDADPRCTPGLRAFQNIVAVDNSLRVKNQRRLHQLVNEHRADVIVHSAHDPVELDRFTSAHPR